MKYHWNTGLLDCPIGIEPLALTCRSRYPVKMVNRHSDTKRKKKKPSFWSFRLIAIISILAFIAVFIIYFYHAYHNLKDDEFETGKFGDSFGVLNAFFSGAAMLAVSLTLYHGMQQVREQSRQHTLDEFSNHFFQLLSSFQELINQLSYLDVANVECKGRDVINRMRGILRETLVENGNRVELSVDDSVSETDKDFSETTFYMTAFIANNKVIPSFLGHYFRLLYNIIKYIDEQPDSIFTIEIKKRYARLIRAHLSYNELDLICINCLSPAGMGMRELIDRYDLLQNYFDHDNRLYENAIRHFPRSKKRAEKRRERALKLLKNRMSKSKTATTDSTESQR